MARPPGLNAIAAAPDDVPGAQRPIAPGAPRADLSADRQPTSMTVAEAQRVVGRAAERYFESRRRRVDSFVDRHFSLMGSLALHRKALGWDTVRAPLNIALAVPFVALQLGGLAAKAVGAARLATVLRSRRVLLDTDVGREIEWLIMTELLELPFRQGDCVSTKDAMLEAILAEEPVIAILRAVLDVVGGHAADPDFRARLEQSVAAYSDSRAAAADIATTMMSLGAGAAALKQITPGALVLGPALAGIMAQQAAVSSFPLGTTLGGMWYAAFPVTASPALVTAVTGGVLGGAAIAAAFSGVLTDPLQRVAGLHRRRLLRLIDALQRQFAAHDGSAFVARDHYVARLAGLLDLFASAYRLAAPR